MTAIQALSSLPAPSGGAVRLTVHSAADDLYALVLASADPTPPDPVFQQGARKVHGGKLRYRVPGTVRGVAHDFLVMDLDADALRDGTLTYYHAYELHPDGSYGPPLSVEAEPGCAREAAVVIARDIVKKRLRYHLRRAVEGGVVENVYEIPVLEQEVRAEGQPLPAVYVKERVNPNPSADTVGHQGGQFKDAHTRYGAREFRFEYSVSVDLLLLCDNPDDRTNLEAHLRGALDADRELFMAAGIENPQVSAFTRHDVDDQAGVDTYGSEISLAGGVVTRVTEIVAQPRPTTVRR